MTKTIITAFITLSISALFITSCTKDSIVDNGTKKTPAPTPAPSVLVEQYENEGFINKDLYRVIIIKPGDIATDDATLESQARSKAIASIKKYISSRGKSLTSNTNAEILNLINESGSIKRVVRDGKVLFVLDISRPGCRAYIDSLGQ